MPEGTLHPIHVRYLENRCMSFFRRHVPVRTLAEYLTGELSLIKRVDVESHVGTCSRCAGKLAKLERLIVRIRGDTAQDPLVSIIDRAVQMFNAKKVRGDTSSHSLRRVLAVLHFDSAGLAPTFGVRSARPGARQLLFRAGTDQIDLRIEPNGHEWTVSGQILGASPASGKAILQGINTSETILNEMSEFVWTSVQADTYRLILKLTTAIVEIEEIRIGS